MLVVLSMFDSVTFISIVFHKKSFNWLVKLPDFHPTQISRGRDWDSECPLASAETRTDWTFSIWRIRAGSWARSWQSPSRSRFEKTRPEKKFQFFRWTFFGCLTRGCCWVESLWWVTNPKTELRSEIGCDSTEPYETNRRIVPCGRLLRKRHRPRQKFNQKLTLNLK